MSRKSYAILGTGRFSNCLSRMLTENGNDVVVVDDVPDNLDEVEEYVDKVIIGDYADIDVLEEIGIRNFDVVIIGSSRSLERNMMATTICKDLGCEQIIAKAASDLHGKMLTRLGADKVIFPEIDMAKRLGRSLIQKSLLDFIKVSEDFSIVEIVVPEELVGKTIAEMKIRDINKVIVVLIKSRQGDISLPEVHKPLEDNSILVVMGKNADLEKFQKAFNGRED